MAAAGVAVAVETVARLGKVDPDPRLAGLLAVVYAALFGRVSAAAVAVLSVTAYSGYFYSPHGPRPQPGSHIVYLLSSFAVIACTTASLVIALRRHSQLTASAALRRERGRGEAKGEELDRQAALNLAVINSLPAHIAVLDSSGRIVATNRAWNDFAAAAAAGSGATAGAAALAPGADYLHACGADPSSADIARGIREVIEGLRGEFASEYPWVAPDGRRWFLLTVTPLAGGRGAVVAHLDITSRRSAEDALRHRADELAALARSLQRTNQELDQFAYVTSHDLRAPLRGIANLSSWIEEDMGDKFTPEAHQQMELLRGRVHRMEAMIDGILEYSRVGRVVGATQEIDLARLLAETIDLLDPPGDVTFEVQPGMPVLAGERLRLQQVFMNLIGNAIKHNDARPRRVAVGWGEDGPNYEFSITDNGPGIEPQYHDKIFVIFQTLQPRDKVEGTGVGLSLVKKIVEHAGGRVWVESAAGLGTTFRFTWPKRPHEAARESDADQDGTAIASAASVTPAAVGHAGGS